MHLLAFPSEILDEILGYMAILPTSLIGSNPNFPNQDILNVAATCQRLRSLALKFIYSNLVASSKFPFLKKYLKKYPHIATCIRQLALWPTGHAYLSAIRGILASCTRLQGLSLGSGTDVSASAASHGCSVDVILGHLAPESKKSLKSLKIYANLLNLSKSCMLLFTETAEGDFGELREVQLAGEHYSQQEHFESETLKYLLEASGELGSARIESVRTLRLLLPFPYQFEFEEPSAAGRFFAKLMPNIGVLFLGTNAECTYSMLSTYTELGSNLTELVLEDMNCGSRHGFNFGSSRQGNHHPHHICEIIPKLSRNLTKFCTYTASYNGHRFCHLLFGEATDWPKLVELDVTCQSGCAGIKLDQVHRTMTELTQTRPQASLRLANTSMHGRQDCQELVCWNLKGEKYIANLGMFGGLDPSNRPLWPEIDSDSDSDEFDDNDDYDIDLDLDLEDALDDLIEDEYCEYQLDFD